MSDFMKWPHIEKLHNMQTHARKTGQLSITYRAKVKLHGTNAAVRVDTDGTVTPQSRNKSLNLENDNFGFAKWALEQVWPPYTEDYVVFGEWVGEGVQRGIALSKVEGRHFAIFAAKFQGDQEYLYDPEALALTFPGHRVVPWFGPLLEIDMSGHETAAIAWLNEATAKIDAECPWTKSEFGVSGVGEGLVCYPVSTDHIEGLMFKVKGESHAKGGAAPAKVKPPISASVPEFAASVATEARFLQFFVPGSTIKDIGPFLGALCNDIKREATAEMEASQLDWKAVNPAVVKLAKEWFLGKL